MTSPKRKMDSLGELKGEIDHLRQMRQSNIS